MFFAGTIYLRVRGKTFPQEMMSSYLLIILVIIVPDSRLKIMLKSALVS